jgi:hypothetical protein
MNLAMALEHGRIGPARLGDMLTFVGLPSKRSARELSGSAEELFKGITEVIDDILARAIENRTASDFKAMRKEAFGNYFRIIIALSNLAQVIVPKPVIERLVGESFSEMEATFRDEGLARFGVLARDQAMFTVWTLRKISRLASQIANSGPVPEDMKEADSKLATDFALSTGWTQFHLDCLNASIQTNKTINPEVLLEICDGLRTAVNAYGLIRQGAELRLPHTQEPLLAPYAWDDEDQELVASSMHDMESEVL